jgi:hypothetical protein
MLYSEAYRYFCLLMMKHILLYCVTIATQYTSISFVLVKRKFDSHFTIGYHLMRFR